MAKRRTHLMRHLLANAFRKLQSSGRASQVLRGREEEGPHLRQIVAA